MNNTDQVVNLGVIGALNWGDVHLREAQAIPAARVLAVCDADQALAEAAARKYGAPHAFTDYRDLVALADLDAVVVAAPHFLHHPMTLAALKAGKHVLCEKPFTIASRQADELVRAARAAGRVLACDYNLRVTRGVRAMRRIVADGLVGAVYYAKTRLMARWTGFMFTQQTNWRVSKAKAGGGILIGRGCHMIDAILFILGQPRVRSVFATCHNRLTGFEVDDLATVSLVLDGGGVVNVEVSYVLNEPDEADQFYYAVYGTAGGASSRNPVPGGPEGGVVAAGRCDLKTGQWQSIPLEPILQAEGGPAGQPVPRTLLGDFVEGILAGRPPLATGEQAARITRLIEAGYESAATGRAVDVG